MEMARKLFQIAGANRAQNFPLRAKRKQTAERVVSILKSVMGRGGFVRTL